MPGTKKADAPKSKFPAGHFSLWVTLPLERRPVVRGAAAALDLPMSEFARRAVEEAVRRVQAGERPFPDAQ
jgi:hypothetical protein